MSSTACEGVAATLQRSPEHALSDWLERFETSPLRFPGAVDRAALRALVEPAFAALIEALADAEEPSRRPSITPAPGSMALRECERLFAFVGGALAGKAVSTRESSAFDASALGCALRDTLLARADDPDERAALVPFCDWLTALLAESFAAAGRQGERERFHDLLEARVPVIAVSPSLPAALVLGDDRCSALASALERLVLQVARTGARVVIIDVSGLDGAERTHNLQALEHFVAHRKIAGAVEVAAVGLGSDAAREWKRLASASNVRVTVCETFLAASVHASHVAPAGVVRSP